MTAPDARDFLGRLPDAPDTFALRRAGPGEGGCGLRRPAGSEREPSEGFTPVVLRFDCAGGRTPWGSRLTCRTIAMRGPWARGAP